MSASHRLTQLLIDWSAGDQEALEKLIPLVESELHRLASRYMTREHLGHTLQTTALVNEAYLRLIDQKHVRWKNRAHFFAIAAQLMRRILLDYARAQHRVKRGGGAHKVSLSDVAVLSTTLSAELVSLDDALNRLAQIDERKSKVVELRYFGGLTVDETAEVLKISPLTVMRDWSMARAWLRREMGHE